MHWFCKYDDVTTTRPHNQRLWLYLHSYKLYDNQTSKEGRPACTDFVLHVMDKSPQAGLVINIYGFTSTSVSPITTKFRRMVDQNTLILPCKYDGVTTSSHDQGLFKNQTSYEAKPTCIDLTLELLMSLLQLGHVTKVYRFISTSINSITTLPQ